MCACVCVYVCEYVYVCMPFLVFFTMFNLVSTHGLKGLQETPQRTYKKMGQVAWRLPRMN
jgi:hypothetical protein